MRSVILLVMLFLLASCGKEKPKSVKTESIASINEKLEREQVVLIAYKYGIAVDTTKAVLNEYRQRHDMLKFLEVKPHIPIDKIYGGHEETISTINDKYKVPKSVIASMVIDFKIIEPR